MLKPEVKQEGIVSQEQDHSAERKEYSERVREILQTVDSFIRLHLYYEPKDNEGQDALIFKLDLQTDIESLPDEDKDTVEAFIGESKSLKILKVLDPEKANHEFAWQRKAWEVMSQIPEQERSKYAQIPKPFRHHTIAIDEQTKDRLNRQNANLTGDEVSAILMEWVEGEDLLTIAFRRFLAKSPAYADMANDPNVNVQSLLIAVNSEFKTRGLDYGELSVREQYSKLFNSIKAKEQPILNSDQLQQVRNTLNYLHKQGVYHNDLHLRNLIIGNDGKVYIIDFARAESKQLAHENNIDDEFLPRFLESFDRTTNELDQKRASIMRDIERITLKDEKFKTLATALNKGQGADLMQLLISESVKWPTDSSSLLRVVGYHNIILENDPAKAIMIREFLKEKKKTLAVEGKQIITLGLIEKEPRE